MASDEDRRRAGRARRAAVLGEAHVAAAEAGADAFTAAFQDLVTRHAWGDVWSRPGLDERTRRLVTIALLAAQGLEWEVKLHVRAALAARIAPATIAETLLHASVYAGIPKANAAFRWAREVMDETPGAGP